MTAEVPDDRCTEGDPRAKAHRLPTGARTDRPQLVIAVLVLHRGGALAVFLFDRGTLTDLPRRTERAVYLSKRLSRQSRQ